MRGDGADDRAALALADQEVDLGQVFDQDLGLPLALGIGANDVNGPHAVNGCGLLGRVPG